MKVGISHMKVGISRVAGFEPSVSREGMYRRMPGVANGGWLFSVFAGDSISGCSICVL